MQLRKVECLHTSLKIPIKLICLTTLAIAWNRHVPYSLGWNTLGPNDWNDYNVDGGTCDCNKVEKKFLIGLDAPPLNLKYKGYNRDFGKGYADNGKRVKQPVPKLTVNNLRRGQVVDMSSKSPMYRDC